MEIICRLLVSIMEFVYGDFIFSSAYNCYYIPACIYGTKITAPYNGVVQFILNNRRKFGRASDRGCETVLMVYGLWFSCIWSQNKTRKKVMLTSDLCWDYYLGIVPTLSDYTSVLRVGQCLVLFYIHFHYRICFDGFRYEIRF